MKKITVLITASLMVFASFLVSNTALAGRGERRVEVTITNITRNQIFSPPVVISHSEGFQLFELGQAASDELYPLAEDGDTTPLTEQIAGLPSVLEYAVAAGPVMPGESVTLEVTIRGNFRFVSVAGMLVTTNDGFFAIRGERASFFSQKTFEAEAYDAGSEANTESCDFIPGPPCGKSGVRDTAEAEGYVHIHAGIHGIGNIDASTFDWRNPVAEITISPTR